MANHYKLDVWKDGNGRLNLNYTDSLSVDFDIWVVYDPENGWLKTVPNEIDSSDENEWFKLESIENIADEIVSWLTSLQDRTV